MTEPGAPEPAIEFVDVSYAYGSGRQALRAISMRVAPGELLGIIGPNGGGKSTLLRLALGLLEPDAGHVRVLGLPPGEARRRGLIGFVPQECDADLSFPLSVRQVVAMGASWRTPFWRRASGAVRDRIEHALGVCGIREIADSPIGSLSGGQRQRALIARAIAGQPSVLALDEPLASIDESGRRRFSAMLAQVHAELGLTILMVTHDLRSIGAVAGDADGSAGTACDRIACLRTTLHFHDAPEGITPALLAEVFEHDLSDVFGRVHVDAHPRDACDHIHPPGQPAGHAHEKGHGG